MLVRAAFELKGSPFPKGKQIQHLSAKTVVTVIFKLCHTTQKCNSLLNSREIQCPVTASSLHHSKIVYHKYVRAPEAYGKECPQQYWEFPASQEQGRKCEKFKLYERKQKEVQCVSKCRAKLRWGSGGTQWGWVLALSRALVLSGAPAADCDVLGVPHTTVLQTRLALLLHWDFITPSIRIWKESILQLWTPVAYLLFIIVFIMVALNRPNIQRYHRVQPWREADEEADPACSNKMQKADVAMQKGFCVVSFSLPCLLVPRDVGDGVLVLLGSITVRRTYFQGSRNCKKLLSPLARARF